MRHNVYGKKLGRDKNQRTALFRSLVQELIIHGDIKTTETKAKAIKGLVDKIINQAKNKNTQRLLQTFFVSKQVQERLVKEVAPNLKSRNSGYTSVVKLGPRLGDGAMVVRMRLLLEESKIKNQESSEKADENVIANKVKQSQNMDKIASSKTPRNDENIETKKLARKVKK